MQRVQDFCVSSNKWDVFITPLPSRLRELWGSWTKRILQARCGMQLQETMFSRHPQADAHVNSERLWKHGQSCTNSSYTKPNPAWGRSGHKSLTSSWESIHRCLLGEVKKKSSLQWSNTGHFNHIWSTQTELHVFNSFFLFPLFLRGEKEHKVGSKEALGGVRG